MKKDKLLTLGMACMVLVIAVALVQVLAGNAGGSVLSDSMSTMLGQMSTADLPPKDGEAPTGKAEDKDAAAAGAPLTAVLSQHLAGMEGRTAIDLTSPLYTEYNRNIVEWYSQASLLPVAWTQADELASDALMRMYAVIHYNDKASDDVFSVPAAQVEAFIQQYFAVTASRLRLADCYDGEANCYVFHGMDGLGSATCALTGIERLNDTDYRLVLEYSDRQQVGYYHAFTIRVQGDRFHYLSGEGNVEY